MILGHAIALDTTEAHEAHFRRACGVARFAYNWALQTWNEMHAAGEKPSVAKVKARWNAHRKAELPWSFEVTKCASGQAVVDLGTAFANFFRDLKKPKGKRRARFPRFKSKRSDNGFALWNDQFEIQGDRIRIPRLGWVKMREPLRFSGKIMGARIARIGTRWHVSVQIDVGDVARPSAAGDVVGIDLGIATLMTLSRPLPDGRTAIANPKARRALMKRQRKLARRISRQELQRRRTNAKASRRQRIRQDGLRKLHYRIACVRKDAIHKATAAITAAFSTIVLEDLNVAGMAKNHRLAGSVLDASFHEARRQFEYKATMRGGRVVIADRFFPSSKLCSGCGHRLDKLPLSKREWVCPGCGSIHCRDGNAATNLELVVGPTWPEPSAGVLLDTRGETGALAASQDATKLWSLNRELNQPASVGES
jgi:putative transposase